MFLYINKKKSSYSYHENPLYPEVWIYCTGIQDTSIVERGRNIVSCSRDGTAKLWDCGTKQCLGTFSECGGIVNSCAVGAVSGAVELGQPESTPSKIMVNPYVAVVLKMKEKGLDNKSEIISVKPDTTKLKYLSLQTA